MQTQNKNIVLIEPSTGEKAITSFRYPPMGLLALGTYLLKQGYNIKLIDASIDNLETNEIVRQVEESKANIIGISSMSVSISQAFKIAEKLKENNHNIKVVIGGVHPTVAAEHALSCPAIDIAVIGEGEITATELLKALEQKKDFGQIDGLAYKQNGKIVINKRRVLIKDLDSLPMPNYSLIEIEKYKSPYAKRTPFISMVRSRGCPFHCIFCANHIMFGANFRCQSAERTIKEIDKLIQDYGVKEISFKDTELTLDRNLERLCDSLIEKKYDLIWTCNSRANNVSENLYKKMKQAGCCAVTFGVESGNDEILKILKKNLTTNQVRKAVATAKRAGLQVVTNFMIGNPHDTKETIEQTIKFAIELDTDYAYFGFTTPFPGTELRTEAELNNWVLNNSMDAIRYDECMMNATSVPTEELKTYLDKAYRRFYFRPKYILRRLTKLDKGELKNSIDGAKSILKNAWKQKFGKKIQGASIN